MLTFEKGFTFPDVNGYTIPDQSAQNVLAYFRPILPEHNSFVSLPLTRPQSSLLYPVKVYMTDIFLFA